MRKVKSKNRRKMQIRIQQPNLIPMECGFRSVSNKVRHMFSTVLAHRTYLLQIPVIQVNSFEDDSLTVFFCLFFWRSRPLFRLCRPFMIFEGWPDSNPECCRSKLASYRLGHPFLWQLDWPVYRSWTWRWSAGTGTWSGAGPECSACAKGSPQLFFPVLGIRDIQVRIRIRGLVDPDPTPFFSDFKDAKNFSSYFFLLTYPQAHYLQS